MAPELAGTTGDHGDGCIFHIPGISSSNPNLLGLQLNVLHTIPNWSPVTDFVAVDYYGEKQVRDFEIPFVEIAGFHQHS